MVTFRQAADPLARDVVKDDRIIGSIQWHPGRDPRFVLSREFYSPTLSELKEIVQQLEEKVHGYLRESAGRGSVH
jgi:hypothetical protein